MAASETCRVAVSPPNLPLAHEGTDLDSLLQEMIFGSSKDNLPKEERLMSRRPGEQRGQTYLRDLTRYMKSAICYSAPHVKLSSRVLTWLLHRNHAVFSIKHVDPFLYFFDDDRWRWLIPIYSIMSPLYSIMTFLASPPPDNLSSCDLDTSSS